MIRDIQTGRVVGYISADDKRLQALEDRVRFLEQKAAALTPEGLTLALAESVYANLVAGRGAGSATVGEWYVKLRAIIAALNDA